MADDRRPGGWSDIGDGESADGFIEYLARVTAQESVQAYKRRSHELLGPTPGDRILDVGCGRGDDVLMLADEVGAGGEVVGVDASGAMIERARERAGDVPTATFETGDALDLAFADDSFDAARADRVLQHLEDPAGAVAELRRVTRPGGRVGVCEPDWGTMVIDAPGGLSERFLSLEHGPGRNPRMGRRLYRLAGDAGLEDVDVDTWTGIGTDFARMRRSVMLDAWTDAMRRAGEATADEIDAWYAGLRRAGERGALFGSLTGFMIAGTVPEEGLEHPAE